MADFTNAILTEPRIFRLDQGALQWLNTNEALRAALSCMPPCLLMLSSSENGRPTVQGC